MSGILDTLLHAGMRGGPTILGVATAQVIDNLDSLGQGRVQLSLPWQPEVNPWARVAVPDAGADRGTWFIPQVGDEVLVAFAHGDELEPYVIGALWNATDTPPATAPNDAVARRIIKTPAGHTIDLDDTQQSITITSATEQTVTITPDQIELSAGSGAAVVKLESSGKVTLQAAVKLELKAPSIAISATNLELSGDGAATLKAGGSCTVQGSLVRIN